MSDTFGRVLAMFRGLPPSTGAARSCCAPLTVFAGRNDSYVRQNIRPSNLNLGSRIRDRADPIGMWEPKRNSAGQTGGMGSMPGMTTSPASSQASFNDADVTFAQTMVSDHEMTAKMAEMPQQKSTSHDLKTLAGEMLKGQPQDVKELQGWLKTWGKPTSSDMADMNMPGSVTDKDMTMLKSMSGMNFDMMFARR